MSFCTSNTSSTRTLYAVLVGDFFHNFADGVFIGAAFMSCDPAFGWSVAVSTILHEISQELADFFILTGVCGLSPTVALILNFVSGLSVVAGALIIAFVEISNPALGYILAIGGGIYIQVGGTEMLPRAFGFVGTLGRKVECACLLLFCVGAVVIGLALIGHNHCATGGSHDGHNH
ncbi:hypothetical protein TeGR_g9075 [Tetraparma gracilis]|uniref:Uncharacterized protein n=1 Tax=Tetraparma gracilis TaxID=2962635 RepID=A0ABQ6MA67_9STRA|nr:hypothetical protein TeGR_g9075 [Tetraparma gracilis]